MSEHHRRHCFSGPSHDLSECIKCGISWARGVGTECAPSAVNDAAGELDRLIRWAADAMAGITGINDRMLGVEPPAEGATAPNNESALLIYDEVSDMPPGFWERYANPPAKAPNRPAQSVPGLGHALHQVNRPVTLCGLATRYMGGRD